MNFIRAAEAAGLGCCPISVIRNHIEEVAQLLELPDFVFPVAGMTAGYPSDDGYLSLRLPPAVNVHINTYNDAQLEQEIDSYDKRRDSIFSIPPDITNDEFPRRIDSSDSITAFNPDPQTLLIVKHSVLYGKSAPRAACLAGAWPKFADKTLPIVTDSILFLSRLFLVTNSLITHAPKSVAFMELKDPWKAPIAVLV